MTRRSLLLLLIVSGGSCKGPEEPMKVPSPWAGHLDWKKVQLPWDTSDTLTYGMNQGRVNIFVKKDDFDAGVDGGWATVHLLVFDWTPDGGAVPPAAPLLVTREFKASSLQWNGALLDEHDGELWLWSPSTFSRPTRLQSPNGYFYSAVGFVGAVSPQDTWVMREGSFRMNPPGQPCRTPALQLANISSDGGTTYRDCTMDEVLPDAGLFANLGSFAIHPTERLIAFTWLVDPANSGDLAINRSMLLSFSADGRPRSLFEVPTERARVQTRNFWPADGTTFLIADEADRLLDLPYATLQYRGLYEWHLEDAGASHRRSPLSELVMFVQAVTATSRGVVAIAARPLDGGVISSGMTSGLIPRLVLASDDGQRVVGVLDPDNWSPIDGVGAVSHHVVVEVDGQLLVLAERSDTGHVHTVWWAPLELKPYPP